MIQISLYDFDLGYQTNKLYVSIQSNNQTIETHLVNTLPIISTLDVKEFKLIFKEGTLVIGSVSFSQKLLLKSLNLVRWITLFDPKDDQYDGNFLEDDLEQPRILLRIETNVNQSQKYKQNSVVANQFPQQQKESSFNNQEKKKIQQIIDDHKEMHTKYQSLKDDLLNFRDLTGQEIKQLEQEKNQYLSEIKFLKQQLNQAAKFSDNGNDFTNKVSSNSITKIK